jgi:hypothetical protein
MEAFFTIIGAGAALVIFSALSVLLGTDSRDGFTERAFRPTYR